MSPASVRYELIQLGVRVEVEVNRLRFFPRSKVPLELLAEMRKNKAGLLKLFPQSSTGPSIPPPCWNHFGRRMFWQHIQHEHVICAICHPPHFPEDVRRWFIPHEYGHMEDSNDYLAQWARQLSESVSTEDFEAMIRRYNRQTRNMDATPEDRRFARQRAKALKAQLPQR